MFKLKHLLFIIFCVGFFLPSKATHNRAGEITYKWLFGYTYQIKVTTYTNIGGANVADRCEDTVYFGDGTHASIIRSNGPIGACAPAGDGVAISPTIKLNEYVTTHTYPGPGNYVMSMEDPNRNAGVINIPNSVNQTFYIESYLVIPTFGSGKNDSPVLTFPPIDNGCVTQCFYHNPGSYDIDGDSISYELTNCRGTGGTICPGYNYPATGGGIYHVDSLTGTLTWCTPQLQGAYNLAMLIKEWRLDNAGNYFLVGYVERDLQVEVGSCNNYPPQIQFNNLDTCIIAGTVLTNTISATDANAEFITLSANGGSFASGSNPSTFITTPANSNTSGIFNWNTDSTHIRRLPYQVTVKVKDNNAVINLAHFKTYHVKVLPAAPIMLTTDPHLDHIILQWHKPAAYTHAGANSFLRYKVYRKTGLSNWVHTSTETVPPSYTGFVFVDNTTNNVNDTLYGDYNSGTPFVVGQNYSYVVLAEYKDGSMSYVSNISSNQIYVGIRELSSDNSSITIFPNPVSENLTITFSQNTGLVFTIDLLDITGRKLKTLNTNESTIQLQTENIKPGIYFLKITDNNNTTITKKIIKQ